MLDWLIPVLAGGAAGILSGFGVGGGSLLLIYMTGFACIPQQQAQGINLLYFLPAAGTALPSHIKNGFIEKNVVVPAICSGLLCSGLAAWLSNSLEVGVMRKLFGVFLLYVGVMELFRKEGKASNRPKDAPEEF